MAMNIIYATVWINLTMLAKIKEIQKSTYCVTSFTEGLKYTHMNSATRQKAHTP